MNTPTHYVYGLNAAILLANNIPIDIMVSFDSILFAGFSALIPDIDHPGSTVSKLVTPISKIFNWVEAKTMPSNMKHRGFTHTLILPSICVAAYYITKSPSFLYMGVGIMSHIVLDMLTVAGVPIFYPFTTKRFRFANIRTGKGAEKIVYYIGWTILGMLLIRY